jgi:hypothetical protein
VSVLWQWIQSRRQRRSVIIAAVLVALATMLTFAQPVQAASRAAAPVSVAPTAPGGYVVGVYVCDTAPQTSFFGVRLKATIFQPSRGPRTVRIEVTNAHTWGSARYPSKPVLVDRVRLVPQRPYRGDVWVYFRPPTSTDSRVANAVSTDNPSGKQLPLLGVKQLIAGTAGHSAGCTARKVG